MKFTKLLISLYLICFVKCNFFTTLNNVTLEYVLNFKNKCRSQIGIFALFYGKTIAECVGECGIHTKCAALNYKRTMHKCELFSSVTEGEEKIGDCLYIPSSDIRVISNPCSEKCDYGKACDKVSQFCRDIDCGIPSDIPFGTMSVNVTTHGGRAVYRCHFGYDLQDGDFERTCVLGTWNGTEPTCIQIPNIGCFVESFLYQGTRNSTVNNIQCQRWDSQTPHEHDRNNIKLFPEETLRDVGNYCRDPDKMGSPWCYTVNPKKRWEYCDVEKCQGPV